MDAENLFAAWHEFRRGKREKPDVQAFERRLEDNVFALAEDMRSGCYRPGLYRKFVIRDPKVRVIHKASVRDRLAHHAIHRVLSPIFERSFIYDSYSCRIGKGTHAAVRRLEVFARQVSKNYDGPCWVLKFDIRRFFDSVDHGILLESLKKRVECPRTMGLLANIVGSHVSENPVGGGALRARKKNRRADRQLDISIIRERTPRRI